MPTPEPQVIRALIDTGASFTSIDPSALDALSLTPTGTIEIVTPSTGQGTHTANTYDVDLQIWAGADDPPLLLQNLRVGSCELFVRQGIHALIGRDILSNCILIYNGDMAQFSLCF